jgi:pSer/pThr/pTyr-binding forkhead associated (FHA) protein
MAQKRSGLGELSPRELQQRIEAERTGIPFLLWRGPDEQLQITYLGNDLSRVTIGRAEDSDIALTADSQVSRKHAMIERVGQEWTLVDDGRSRNGSFANAARVLGRRRLADRDRLWFGSSELIYRAGTAQQAASTVSATDRPGALTVTDTKRRVLIALCRPVYRAESPTPATNQEIASELNYSVDAVKAHLRELFERFGISELPQNEKRARLVEDVLASDLLSAREF